MRFSRMGIVASSICVMVFCKGFAGGTETYAVTDELSTIELKTSAEDWQTFKNSPPATAEPVKVSFNGETGEMVYHGNPRSLRTKQAEGRKSSLRIEFANASVKRHLVLRAETHDKSLIREWTGYNMFASAGIISPRGRLVRLKVNKELLGIYLAVEPVDAYFVQQMFPDTAGKALLYYGDPKISAELIPDLTPANTLSQYPSAYTPVINNSDPDFRELDLLLHALNAKPLNLKKLAEIIDIEEWARWFAASEIMENTDSLWRGSARNYSLFRAPGGRWQILPWDLDRIYEGKGVCFPVSNAAGIKNLVAHKEFSRKVRLYVKEFINGELSAESVLKWINTMGLVIGPAITKGDELGMERSLWKEALEEFKKNVIVRHYKLKSIVG